MGRPQKTGLEYYPMDVDMENDEKVVLVEAAHPPGVGWTTLTKLLARIYRQGCYIEWGEREQLILARATGFDVDTVRAVVSDAIKWGFFDGNLHSRYNILTSVGIQKRYLLACGRRDRIVFVSEYYLLNLSKDEIQSRKIVFVTETGVVVTETPVNDVPGTQSKVKETRVKESRESGGAAPVGAPTTKLEFHLELPKHLRKRKDAHLLKPYPATDEIKALWLTGIEATRLEAKLGPELAYHLAEQVEEWAEDKPTKFREHTNHYRVLLRWHSREVKSGKVFFRHPEHGAGYYYPSALRNVETRA